MKLQLFRSLHSQFNSDALLHYTLKKFNSQTITSNYSASGTLFNKKSERFEEFDASKNGQHIRQNSHCIDGSRSKDNALVNCKYWNYCFFKLMINSDIAFLQFGKDKITKPLRKELFMIPELSFSNLSDYISQKDKVLCKMLRLQLENEILRKLERYFSPIIFQQFFFNKFCELLCDIHQSMMQTQFTNNICFLRRDASNYCSPHIRWDNVSHDHKTFLSQNTWPGERYIHNYQMMTLSRIIHNSSSSKQNCGGCRKPEERSLPAATNDPVEKENHSGLLTCNKGRQSGDEGSSSDEIEYEGLLTCKRVGKIIEEEKQAEEKVCEAERRKQLQGTWKNLCKKCIPTKDSITLARTSFWWRIINRLRGNSMDERLQKYLGNSPQPFIRKSLTEKRKEMGVDVSKPIAKWACKGKKKVKKTAPLVVKDEKLNQQAGTWTLGVDRLSEKTVENTKLLTSQQPTELRLEDKKLNQLIDESGIEDKKLKQDKV